jgi:hypothetical protein
VIFKSRSEHEISKEQLVSKKKKRQKCNIQKHTPKAEPLLNNILKIPIKKEGKAVPLQAWSGPEGSRKLRFPDFLTTAQDGGKFVSPTHRPTNKSNLLHQVGFTH